METYGSLAIGNPDGLVFGRCPRPLALRGLDIGGGQVYPEINFTLPPMAVTEQAMPEVLEEYRQMADGVLARAVALQVPGISVELELLPELTRVPSWGAQVTALLRERLDHYRDRAGLRSVLRVTPNDNRDFVRPPLMRRGAELDHMVESFAMCARAGADMLSIESTGGKELNDDALLNGDLHLAVFSLGVLAARDMAFLWDTIVGIARDNAVVPAGDSACGFANTAMTLANGGFVPHVWAAVVRVLSIPRSLVAYERGALGPSKDCAYEGPFLKAITGYPIAMEGAEAACAHESPVGNISRAAADLWSNESVQNVKLLGGMAPKVSMEQLAYATRLMNVAASRGRALELRDWLVASDAALDPQAYVLRPEVVVEIAGEIVAEASPYQRTRRAALVALHALRSASSDGVLTLSPPEQRWLARLSTQADELPEDEGDFIDRALAHVGTDKVRLGQYGLTA
ncbi:MAG TPA: methyltransferase MtaB domain-containing protein [Acidimicrobiales bacterium]|nr:methyltransferase MtaB domain-containing protein [Acidimicrobiales bacterium]